MSGDKKMIEYLNHALKNELTAINQYFLHGKILTDWGYNKLGEQIRKESIDEMMHADMLCDRILFLEGMPNLQDLGKLMIGENTREMLECDYKLEMLNTPLLQEAISYAESIKDYGTRDLLEKILTSEEEHIEWLKQQLHLFDTLGERNYLQKQVD